MMKVKDFNNQLNSARLQKTLQSGDYITHRYEPPCYVYLYNLHGFYVEIWHISSLESQAWCHGFTETDKLDPYLTQVDLKQLSGIAE